MANNPATTGRTPAAVTATGKDYLPLRPLMFSTDAGESAAGLEKFIKLCTFRPLPPDEYYFFLGFNAIVPPYVRQGLMDRALDNDDLLATLPRHPRPGRRRHPPQPRRRQRRQTRQRAHLLLPRGRP